MSPLYGKWDMAIYDLDGTRYSTDGYTMPECRMQLLEWINNAQRDSWANHCILHWINSLGGLAAIW